jgi:hypothetical protein
LSLLLLPPPCCAISVPLRDVALRFLVSCLWSVPSDPCAVLGGPRAAVVPSEPPQEPAPLGGAGVFARPTRQRLCSVPRDPCGVVGRPGAAVVPSAPSEEAVPVGHAAVSARRRRQRRAGMAPFAVRDFAPRRAQCFTHVLLHSYSVLLFADSSSVSRPSTRTPSVLLLAGHTRRPKRIGPSNRRCESIPHPMPVLLIRVLYFTF